MAAEGVVAGYGNWKKPTSPGLFGLGQMGTMLLLGALVIVIIVLMSKGPVAGLGLGAVLFGVMRAVTIRDKHGMNLMSRTSTRASWWRARSGGSNLYRSGPLGRTPWGTCQLPGIAASTQLNEFVDVYDRPFALLNVPATNSVVVVLSTQPEGDSLVDPEQVDLWVSRWGGWLASLSDYLGLEAASVTVETAPDTGTRLRQEVGLNLDPHAPAFARQVLDEVVDSYPRGSSVVKAYVALTISRTAAGRKRSVDEIGRELSAQLPNLTGSLEATGAGAVTPASAAELCEIVRVAYDPATATILDEAAALGQSVELNWADVGPAAHESTWSDYRHDSGLSRTWMVTDAPRGVVQSNILSGLLAPHRDITRKRVTILYQPHDPAVAAALVDADEKATSAMLGDRPTASAVRAHRAAALTAAEQAAGAGLVSFGILFTATVLDREQQAPAVAAIENLAAAARLRTRPVYGSQDSAFAAALPLGLHLPKFASPVSSMAGKL